MATSFSALPDITFTYTAEGNDGTLVTVTKSTTGRVRVEDDERGVFETTLAELYKPITQVGRDRKLYTDACAALGEAPKP